MGKFMDLMNMLKKDPEQLEDALDVLDCLLSDLEMNGSTKRVAAETICKLEEIAYRIPKEEAVNIVKHMTPYGQKWSYDQIIEFCQSKGIEDKWSEWYLVMNMVYNDYYNTAKAFNLQNDASFYFHLAKDFIEDEDAAPFKVQKYFLI